MSVDIAIVAPGMMGSGVARRLVDGGARVTTCLDGRSDATVERARAAGMIAVGRDALADADFVLSILPPGDAVALSRTLAPSLGASPRKPVFVDCNAVSPATMGEIAAIVTAAGGRVVDAGIIGAPPKPGGKGPVFYASGEAADVAAFARLADFGLQVSPMDGGIGTASAMKMSYAGITKGLTAIGTAMILAAERGGVADALHAELATSQPELLAWLTRQLPRMPPKAYRWDAEMQEIGAFAGDAEAGTAIYNAIAELYRAIATDPDAAASRFADFFETPQTKKN
jgi:3-hydroxyisobutyrate dehydrogenase-like beta-hydroxyacid dehydrogenase